MYYGVLVMVVCDSEGIVYDLWFHPASYHEVRQVVEGVNSQIKLFNYGYAMGNSFFRKSPNMG